MCGVPHDTSIIRFSQAESSLQNSRVASPRLYTPTNQPPRKRVVSNISSSPPKLSPLLGLTRGAIRLASMDQRREKSARGCQDHLSQLRVRGTKRRGRLESEKKRFSESFRSARSETAVEESGRPFTRARVRLSLPCSPRLRAVLLSLSLSLPYLLESDVLGVLPETPPAHLKPVLADDSVVASAHAAEGKSESESEVKFIGQPCRPVRGRALSLPPRSTGRLAGQVELSLFPPCRPSVARTYQGWEPRPYFLG